MRTPVLAALSAAAAVALLATGTSAAQAQATDDLDVGFLVVEAPGGGGLSVNTGGPSATLGIASDGGTASGTLTVFSVTDRRNTTNGWNAYVSISDFKHASIADAVIPATAATYRPPATAAGLVFGGTATRAAADIPLSNDDALVMTRSARNTPAALEVASWTNTNALSVDLSSGVALGQYKATLTLSAL